MAHCDEYVALISAAIDGALSPAEQKKLAEHLASCPECQALYEELTALHTALSGLPPVEVPADLTERILAAVAAEQILPQEKKKSPIPWQRWLASAAVLAVVVAGAWSWKPWVHDDAGSQKPESAPAAMLQNSTTDSAVALPEASEDTESVLLYTSGTEAPDSVAPVFPSGDKAAAAKVAGATQDTALPVYNDSDAPAGTLEEPGETSFRMSRMVPAPERGLGDGWGDGGEPALATEAPQEVEEIEKADLEEALPVQPYRMVTTGLPTGDAAPEAILTAEEAATETILTAREALDLTVARCFGDSGYEMVREDLGDDPVSCHVSLMDGDVFVVGGTVVCTGESEEFFLFACHWDDDPENPYHYSVHKSEGYVAWQGEAPIDGKYQP